MTALTQTGFRLRTVLNASTRQRLFSIWTQPGETPGPGDFARRRGRARWLGLLTAFLASVACSPGLGQTVVASVPVGPHPDVVAVNQTTNTIYVADLDFDTVTAIDGATNTATTIQIGGKNALGDLAVNEKTNTVYALNDGTQSSSLTGIVITPGFVAVINGATNTVTATIALPDLASHMAVNPVTNQIYVSTLSAIGNGPVVNVTVIDGATNTITKTISIPLLVSELAVDSARNLIYAMNISEPGNGNLAVIDGATGTVKGTIQVGYNDTGFTLNPTTNIIYVPDAHGNQVYVIDGATLTVTATVPIPAPLSPVFLAVNPVSNTIYLSTYNTSNASDSIQVISGSTNTITASISDSSASGPFALGTLLVNSVTNKIWMASSPVVIIDGATNSTTSVAGTGTTGSVTLGALNTATNYAYMAEPNNVFVINGAAAGPAFSASPSPLPFPNQTQGTTSSAMTLTVTNVGTTDLSITTVTAGGTNVADFPVGSDSCANSTVAAGKTCTVSVQFEPSTTGSESATLTFADNAPNSPQSVTFTGTGVAPVATATTTTLSASATSVAVGTSVTLTATVKPASGTPTPTGTVTFIDGANTLGTGTLNGSGVATYSASSLALGAHSLTASYAGDSRNTASASSAITVTVTVGATTTTLTASPTSVALGSSVTFTATVAGTSGVSAPTGTVTFMNGTTALGTGTLNGSGTATYTATSLAAGSYSVTAAYAGDANNAASTSSAVAVNVWPGAQDFSISLSPSSGSVSRGKPMTVTVTITSVNGFASATTLSCSGLPKNSTCDFSSPSVTPAVAGTATSTLTLKADTNTATAALDPGRNGPEWGAGRVAYAMLGALFLLPVLGSRRRKLRHLLQTLGALLLLAFVASGGMTGCGGGPTTPAGTYSVQIAAASGSTTHQATFSLTVQ